MTAAWRPSPMVQIAAFPTRSDAELAQSALAAAGIQSEVASDDAGGAYPFDFSGGARLLVAEADAEDAAAILAGPPQPDGKE
jgi:Putative prokaryotic signal transducing protein